MNGPRVSCVLPTHNGSRYLREAISSVLGQAERDWELIVVDDCSSDDAPKIIEEFVQRDSRIRSFRNPTNLKLPASLNAGFRQARGKYWTWTSDDNLFEPQAFRTLTDFLDRHPDVGLAYSDFLMIDENGAVLYESRVPEADRLPVVNCVAGSFMYRREVQEQLGGYREDRFLTEDYDFWLRASKKFKLAAVHEYLYRYRAHSGSLSETRRAEIDRATWYLMRDHLPSLGWASRQALATGYLYQAERGLRLGRRSRAMLDLAAAFRKSPGSAWRALKELLHGHYRGWRARRSGSEAAA